jgi:hypothetical protein
MPCYSPLTAWMAAPPNRGVVFTARFSSGPSFQLPCGRCIGCRLARSAEWATRISHEASLHQFNSFLTLTYSDQHLPYHQSVSIRELQLFLKRLRKSLEPQKVRFVACGEYGEKTFRPHYHVILFGHDFMRDRYPWKKSKSGHQTYRSPSLEKLWPYGHCEIGTVTPQSGGYVAKYTTKKIYGDSPRAIAHYTREGVDDKTGEVRTWEVQREFLLTSRRPGIGAGWYERFSADAFPSDFVVVQGKKRPVPRYYRQKLALENAELAEELKERRAELAEETSRAFDNTPERLREREEFTTLTSARFTRDTET